MAVQINTITKTPGLERPSTGSSLPNFGAIGAGARAPGNTYMALAHQIGQRIAIDHDYYRRRIEDEGNKYKQLRQHFESIHKGIENYDKYREAADRQAEREAQKEALDFMNGYSNWANTDKGLFEASVGENAAESVSKIMTDRYNELAEKLSPNARRIADQQFGNLHAHAVHNAMRVDYQRSKERTEQRFLDTSEVAKQNYFTDKSDIDTAAAISLLAKDKNLRQDVPPELVYDAMTSHDGATKAMSDFIEEYKKTDEARGTALENYWNVMLEKRKEDLALEKMSYAFIEQASGAVYQTDWEGIEDTARRQYEEFMTSPKGKAEFNKRLNDLQKIYYVNSKAVADGIANDFIVRTTEESPYTDLRAKEDKPWDISDIEEKRDELFAELTRNRDPEVCEEIAKAVNLSFESKVYERVSDYVSQSLKDGNPMEALFQLNNWVLKSDTTPALKNAAARVIENIAAEHNLGKKTWTDVKNVFVDKTLDIISNDNVSTAEKVTTIQQLRNNNFIDHDTCEHLLKDAKKGLRDETGYLQYYREALSVFGINLDDLPKKFNVTFDPKTGELKAIDKRKPVRIFEQLDKIKGKVELTADFLNTLRECSKTYVQYEREMRNQGRPVKFSFRDFLEQKVINSGKKQQYDISIANAITTRYMINMEAALTRAENGITYNGNEIGDDPAFNSPLNN